MHQHPVYNLFLLLFRKRNAHTNHRLSSSRVKNNKHSEKKTKVIFISKYCSKRKRSRTKFMRVNAPRQVKSDLRSVEENRSTKYKFYSFRNKTMNINI